MRYRFRLTIFTVCLACCATTTMTPVQAVAIVYSFVPYALQPDDPRESGGFGYSGTITTEGSVGIFGDDDVPIPIFDWEITLITPGANDRETSLVLTPANSNVTFNALSITAQAISISPEEAGNAGLLQFQSTDADSLLLFNGPLPSAQFGPLPATVFLADLTEPPINQFGVADLGNGQTIVATVIPEPIATLFLCDSSALIRVGRRRR